MLNSCAVLYGLLRRSVGLWKPAVQSEPSLLAVTMLFRVASANGCCEEEGSCCSY